MFDLGVWYVAAVISFFHLSAEYRTSEAIEYGKCDYHRFNYSSEQQVQTG
jgi:hypothetical protein